ncbi:hypothetical protein L596_021883 [Steinernema carpocapsae]|uniref:UPAR/Ly6 domain-containing protein n=1 Tax=Steinernema carpocapsae TaxID=34508 RepID=A0A4U5MK30_STECR|nr:hypothetical protein L596_021883 [Steinernema carpocapsae]
MRSLLSLLALAAVLNVAAAVQCYISDGKTTKAEECPGKHCFTLEYTLALSDKTIMTFCGTTFKDDVKTQLKGGIFSALSAETQVANYVSGLDNCDKPYVKEEKVALNVVPVLGQCCEGHLCNDPKKDSIDRKAQNNENGTVASMVLLSLSVVFGLF